MSSFQAIFTPLTSSTHRNVFVSFEEWTFLSNALLVQVREFTFLLFVNKLHIIVAVDIVAFAIFSAIGCFAKKR